MSLTRRIARGTNGVNSTKISKHTEAPKGNDPSVPGRNFEEKIDNILLAFEEWSGNKPLQEDFRFPYYLGERFK
jgi:hypothetical protein